MELCDSDCVAICDLIFVQDLVLLKERMFSVFVR